MKVSKLKPLDKNPRRISPAQLDKLKASIDSFPAMMELRPIIYDPETMQVLGGNQRLAAIKALGMKEIPDAWAKPATALSEAEKRRFVIQDNHQSGEYDFEALELDWSDIDLAEIGIEVPEMQFEEPGAKTDSADAHAKLSDKFLIPPFSVLDTRQGYWQERKQKWKELINDNGEARSGALCFNTKSISEIKQVGDKYDKDKVMPNSLTNGVSILDPVLAEIACLWFAPDQSKVFDCFAGDTVFGYVSAYRGHTFTGIELRQEQCDFNANRTIGMTAKYICDDAQNVLIHIETESQDMLFSCPPYFDLEVYSSLENDASNQKEYKEFLAILEKAFTDSIKCLKNNRFAFIVVGDVRDKKGSYRMFPDDIKRIFTENGMSLYNDMVLVEQLGTLPQRVAKSMVNRKIGKCHQNVFVFYKGDPKEIKNTFPKLEIGDESENL